MNKKAMVVLGLALVFGAFTAVAVNRVLKRQADKFSQDEIKKVVVAVSPISLGQKVTPDQIKLEDRPKGTLPEGTISDVTQVVDRVSLAEVAIGEALLQTRLAAEGSAAGLAAVIPPGMRAMTVKVDEVIGVAGFIAPGTYVDVVATVVGSGYSDDSTSKIILQQVKVLASDKQIETQQDGEAKTVRTVTLLVAPEQAESLALASTAGKLQLVMRNNMDEDAVETKGVNTAALLGDALGAPFGGGRGGPRRYADEFEPAPQPKPKPLAKEEKPKEFIAPKPQGPTVELIQGKERSTITFQ